ncbi:MAG: GNAT family N-acetyltransferase [Candidatus Cloacimonetes bacterium]|nr:GNAT family N-acetyltransferase [Candidatus Cloacimonadota bacterium]
MIDKLRIEGGHIGYGIRPSARNQGYGTKILELALKKVSEIGIKKVLVTCDKQNIHSARIILKNGGKFDSEIEYNNKIVQRYWIEL